MQKPTLNLVVLRTLDPANSASFYALLGLQFSEHRHGNGPVHFAAELPGCVFELYPLSSNAAPTSGTRIGFSVPSVDEALIALTEYPAAVISPAQNSEWGRRAVVSDPDGHRVELVESR